MQNVYQHGEKSVYIEQNTGKIEIHTNGEIRIIDPKTTEGLALLRAEFAEKFDEILKILQNFNTPKLDKHLTSQPFMPPKFVGREEDLKIVHDLLFHGENFLMIVNGQGGIGKTSFAAKYWQRYDDEYTHLAFVFVANGITEALLNLANVLNLSFPNTMLNENRLEVLIHALGNLNKPCLLILDNANNEEDLDAHIILLRQCPNCHILLTSRLESYSAAEKHTIGALARPLALEHFKNYYPHLTDTEVTLFNDIYTSIGGNTLLLELLAKNLTNFNNKFRKRYTLSQLLDDLQTNLLRLSLSNTVETAYQAKGTGWRMETPEAIISAMYDLSELDKDETILLSIFAVLPAEFIAFGTLEDLLASNTVFKNLDQILLRLVQKGWIEANESGYKVNPVVQAITHYKQPNLLSDCRPLMHYLIVGMSQDALQHGHYTHAAHCAYFAQAMISALQTQIDNNIAELCQNLGNYYRLIGNLSNALAVYTQMQTIQASLLHLEPENANYKNGLAISYQHLGNTHSSLGNLKQALIYFEKDIELSKELHNDYPTNVDYKNNLAISYLKLGDTHSRLDDLKQALIYFKDETKLFKELYKDYPANVAYKNGLAVSYSKLGDTHSRLDDLKQALIYFEKDIELSKQLYTDYPTNVAYKNGLAISYERLGNTHSRLDDLKQALIYFEERNKIGKELHSDYPANVAYKNGLAISYAKLGVFYRDKLKDKAKAKTYFLEAEGLWRALVRDAPQYVQFQQSLGQVQADLKDLE